MIGTMLSAHIYDRTISPRIFIRVAGINTTSNAIKQLGDAGADGVLSGIVTVSAVRFLFGTDLCSLDSSQSKRSVGDEALRSPGNLTDKVIQTKLVCSMGKDIHI